MLSLEHIVRDPEKFRVSLIRRGEDPPIDQILELDSRRKELIQTVDTDRARRNAVSKAIGDEKRKPTAEEIIEMRETGDRIKVVESELEAILAELNETLLPLPNTPLDDVPDGLNEESNLIVHTSRGPIEEHGNAHWDVATELGILDLEAGSRLSGARFYVLKGKGAKLQRALSAWMLDIQTEENGYTEIDPPLLVRPETMIGSGNLPKFRDNLYHDDEADLWLIPTAEVALNGLYQQEIIDVGSLPIKYVAQTPSFRKEHTAGGRDTRGIKRVHQFNKVELVKFAVPETSYEELEHLTKQAESILKKLGLHYRVVELCTGDLSFAAAKCYDLEIWAPGEQKWLEVSSCSNFESFQARRGNIRYRRSEDNKVDFLHTLNGSGVATPRLMVALLETYQTEKGTIQFPNEVANLLGIREIT